MGAGKRAAIIYFDKGGDHYSEREVLDDRFGDAIDWFATGLDRIDPVTGLFRFGVTEEDVKEAQRGLDLAHELVDSGEYDLVVMEEINTTVSLGMLNEKDVLDLIEAKPDHVELVLTGRSAPESFTNAADLVSDIHAVKHYFDAGIRARVGIDF